MRALAANDDAALFGVDVDVVARQAGDFGRQHEAAGRFVQVDRRVPPGSVGADELPDLFVQREQIAERIPACERHDLHRSMFWLG